MKTTIGIPRRFYKEVEGFAHRRHFDLQFAHGANDLIFLLVRSERESGFIAEYVARLQNAEELNQPNE